MASKNSLVKNKPFSYFEGVMNSFLIGSAGTNRGEIQKWMSEDSKLAKRAYASLKAEQNICTIMNPQLPHKLASFFYVPKLHNRNDKKISLQPSELITDNNTTGILISGRLGQGKSMLLRYLQFLELNTGNSIPLFLELQRIKSGNQIISSAINKMNDLGFECSSKLFEYLLTKGHISLFLDGYDEIQFKKRKLFNDEITKIIGRSLGKKIFITSRHDTEIEKLPGLTGYGIQPLSSEDHPLFLKTIEGDKPETNAIIKKLAEAQEFDSTILDTPLLLTWFLMVYKVRRKIPKTKIGFYEELFKTILSRHDGIKGSLDRPSKSKLGDDEIEIVLHAFCYLTSDKNENDFDEATIEKYIKKSLNIAKQNTVKATDYLYDLTHTTCLLVKDGMSYGFMHDSIRSYFAACFVKETNEGNAIKFYEKADKEWRKWGDELNFLLHLDSYRFHKFVITKSISALTDTKENNLSSKSQLTTISNGALKIIFSESLLLFVPSSDRKIRYWSGYYQPTYSYTCHYIFNSGNYDLCETDQAISEYITNLFKKDEEYYRKILKMASKELGDNDRVVLTLDTVLRAGSYINDFYEKIRIHTINTINKSLKISFNVISSEEAKEALF